MTQTDTPKPIHSFEPQTLSSLNITGHILIPAVRYEDTALPKQGLARYLSYLPTMSRKPVSMDIDIGCVLLDESDNIIDCIHYGKVRTTDTSVRHGGDALTGAKEFEEKFINQEQINIHLDKLDPQVHQIIVVIANYHKQALKRANKGIAVLRDNEGSLIHEYEFDDLDKHTHAIIAWRISRSGDDWLIQAPLIAIKHDKMENLLKAAIAHS